MKALDFTDSVSSPRHGYGLVISVDALLRRGAKTTPEGRRVLRLVLDQFPIFVGRGTAEEPRIIGDHEFFLPDAVIGDWPEIQKAVAVRYDFPPGAVLYSTEHASHIEVHSPHTLLVADVKFLQKLAGVESAGYLHERFEQRKHCELFLKKPSYAPHIIQEICAYMK